MTRFSRLTSFTRHINRVCLCFKFQSYDNETHHPYGPNASNETEIYILLT